MIFTLPRNCKAKEITKNESGEIIAGPHLLILPKDLISLYPNPIFCLHFSGLVKKLFQNCEESNCHIIEKLSGLDDGTVCHTKKRTAPLFSFRAISHR